MRILHLEDNGLDAELFGNLIQKEWPDCEIDPAAGRDTFLSRLMGQRYDLILSDFSIVGFDGLDALRIARELTPETPFIFLSGTIGEDRAVEAMRNGAVDYVLKDRPKRLIPAIRRAIAHAEHVHDKRVAEEQLLKMQRLQNIGMLAAGIAHDFNNVLAPILMGIPLLREHVADSGMKTILSNMEVSVLRGAGLVQQILGFAQGSSTRPQVFQPKHVVRELLGIMRQTFPKNIDIEERVQADLWMIEANPTQLHQLLLNLCVNARDAMPAGGALRIVARNQHLDSAAAKVSEAPPGRHVVFEINDTGTGISAEDMARIWEPFYTTKASGRGSGLGLPTVRRIVAAHHGVITLRSIPGRGTTFTVFFPAAESGTPRAEPIETSAPRGNGELILIVDDDHNVRSLTEALLLKHGYRALTAANGVEAVELFTPLLGEVRMVITDLGMPRSDGFALTNAVRSLNPSVRILAMSGMADATAQMQKQQVAYPILGKPFTVDALLRTVHELLAASKE